MVKYKKATSASDFLTQRLDMSGDCWTYQGAVNAQGYGQCANTIAQWELGERLAHRASYRLWCGPIPKGLMVCHKCDNPLCCRPSHLWLGTHKENMTDKRKKQRGNNRAGGRVDQETLIMLFEYQPSQVWANYFGVDHSAVRQILRKHGVPNRYTPPMPVPADVAMAYAH